MPQIIYGQAPEKNYTVDIRRRSDYKPIKILNNILTACSFDYNRKGGCGKSTVTLAMDPADLRLYQGADYELRISIRNDPAESETLYYRGFQEEFKPELDKKGKVTLSFSGYSSMLKRIRIRDGTSPKVYENMEVGAIMRAILDEFIVGVYPITYTLAEHDVSSYTVDRISFDTDVWSAIETLGTLAGNFEYGVDRNLKFYFKRCSQTIESFLKYKRDIESIDEMWDYGGIVNRYIIKGGAGFEDTSNNTESQAIYGLRTKVTSNSAINSQSVSQRYATGLFIEDARPKHRIMVTKNLNTRLYESTLPLGKVAVMREPLVPARKYGTGIKYGSGVTYGGSMASYLIDRITYRLQSQGTSIAMNLGEPRPALGVEIAQLQQEINQLRNNT